jgi:hypothetical protein
MPTVTNGRKAGPGSDPRVVRIARGLLRPSTRSRYTAEARDRVRSALGPKSTCLVCGSRDVRIETVRQDTAATRAGAIGKTFHMRVCRTCGFVGNPENTLDYRTYEHVGDLANAARMGTPERRGREFHMAQMAIDILGRSDLEVLIFGVGRSFDNHHVAGLPEVRHVAIADVMQIRDDAEFIDANLPAPRRFPVVVASEVVEHFLDPRADFAGLFDYVEPDGLLVCGTNLYDGGKLAKQVYIFVGGHVSYYTTDALDRLAAANGVMVDIRIPLVSTGYAGPRKRYLLFTRSAAVSAAIERYFGIHEYAPSESPTADRELAGAVRSGA